MSAMMFFLLQAENISCKTYSTDHIKMKLTYICRGHNFNIVHQNIRSFLHNFDAFSVLSDNLKFQSDVLVLTETWLNADTYVKLPGYEVYHVFRKDRTADGISTYVRDGLVSEAVDELTCITDSLEANIIILSLNSRLTILFLVSTEPGHSIPNFTAVIGNMISSVPGSATVYMVGNMNINLLEPIELPSSDE